MSKKQSNIFPQELSHACALFLLIYHYGSMLQVVVVVLMVTFLAWCMVAPHPHLL